MCEVPPEAGPQSGPYVTPKAGPQSGPYVTPKAGPQSGPYVARGVLWGSFRGCAGGRWLSGGRALWRP